MKLYGILYRLPGDLVLTDGQTERRVDDFRDQVREDDGEYEVRELPDRRRAIHRVDKAGQLVSPPVYLERRAGE